MDYKDILALLNKLPTNIEWLLTEDYNTGQITDAIGFNPSILKDEVTYDLITYIIALCNQKVIEWFKGWDYTHRCFIALRLCGIITAPELNKIRTELVSVWRVTSSFTTGEFCDAIHTYIMNKLMSIYEN